MGDNVSVETWREPRKPTSATLSHTHVTNAGCKTFLGGPPPPPPPTWSNNVFPVHQRSVLRPPAVSDPRNDPDPRVCPARDDPVVRRLPQPTDVSFQAAHTRSHWGRSDRVGGQRTSGRASIPPHTWPPKATTTTAPTTARGPYATQGGVVEHRHGGHLGKSRRSLQSL